MVRFLFYIFLLCSVGCDFVYKGPPINPHLSVGRLNVFKKVIKKDKKNIVPLGYGTGFAVGLHEILTANHVCSSLDEENTFMILSFFNGKEIQYIEEEMTIKMRDEEKDFCLLSLNNNPLEIVNFAKYQPSINDRVYFFGAPKGKFLLTEGYFSYYTDGKIDGKRKDVGIISIPGFSGGSGGPIFNDKNEFIGILLAVYMPFHHISYISTYKDTKIFLNKRYK